MGLTGFAFVLTSYTAGVAKPAGALFHQAEAAAGLAPGSPALHIGDDWVKDVVGALNAGPAWHALWLSGGAPPPEENPILRTPAEARLAIARDVEALAAALQRQ